MKLLTTCLCVLAYLWSVAAYATPCLMMHAPAMAVADCPHGHVDAPMPTANMVVADCYAQQAIPNSAPPNALPPLLLEKPMAAGPTATATASAKPILLPPQNLWLLTRRVRI